MGYGKLGPKALGLLMLVALGLMVFGASGAWASSPTVLVLKSDGSGLLATPFVVEIAFKEHNALEGALLILNLNMEISCHRITGKGTLANTGTGLTTFTFEQCLTKSTEGGATCEIPNITKSVKFLVVAHGGSKYIIFSPHDLLTIAKVLNHTECALPEIANLKGCMAAKVVTTGHAVELLITTKGFLQSLFSCKMQYGVNPLHPDIDVLASLTGAHAGLSWGV